MSARGWMRWAQSAKLGAVRAINQGGQMILLCYDGSDDTKGRSAIVMGSRSLTEFKSLLLGSVSHAVLQRADRTVIVVPSPAVASSRKRRHDRSPGSR